MSNDFDTIIVGGGLVGAALACGIAAKSWPVFARGLRETTGIDIGLQQNGGYDFCLTADEWDARSEEMRLVRRHTRGEFEYEMLDNADLRARIPQVSPEVLGASYSRHDGHVNPLLLLHALHRRMQALGCRYYPNRRVAAISHEPGVFSVSAGGDRLHAARVVLSAGLDNQRLAHELGMHVPVAPLRGQLLITDGSKIFCPAPPYNCARPGRAACKSGIRMKTSGWTNRPRSRSSHAWPRARYVSSPSCRGCACSGPGLRCA